MPPWLSDLLRLVSVGGASNWFGLVCPAHCSLSFPYFCAFFLAGFSLGSLLILLAIGFYLWPWICGFSPGYPAHSQPRVPSTRLAAYLYERPVRPHRLIRTAVITLRALATSLEVAADRAERHPRDIEDPSPGPSNDLDWDRISSVASESAPHPGDQPGTIYKGYDEVARSFVPLFPMQPPLPPCSPPCSLCDPPPPLIQVSAQVSEILW